MVWKYKPWWCQPWSILLTGSLIMMMSWFLLHKLIMTILVSVAIIIWWVYFLIVYPKLMAEVMNDK